MQMLGQVGTWRPARGSARPGVSAKGPKQAHTACPRSPCLHILQSHDILGPQYMNRNIVGDDCTAFSIVQLKSNKDKNRYDHALLFCHANNV